MNGKTTPQHSKGAHALIGVGAAMLGAILGIGLVYIDSVNDTQLKVQAEGTAFCPSGDYDCDYWDKEKIAQGRKCKRSTPCQDTTNGHVCQGLCMSNTNKCDTKKCDGKDLEGKPEDMGMPPMLPMLPMPMPKPSAPKEPEDPCKKNASSSECKATQTPSGVSGFLSNIFGTNSTSGTNASSTGGAIQTTIQSVADKLSAFLSGGTESTANTNTINNPTNAAVTPVVVTGTNAGQITSSGGTQASGSQSGSVQTGGQSAVTGFGSSASGEVNPSTGPILSAIRSITARIQSILSSLF